MSFFKLEGSALPFPSTGDVLRQRSVESVVLYRKAAIVGVGVGLLLAIAVATIDGIIIERLFAGAYVCPDPRCTQAAQFGRSEPMQVLIAFVFGFAGAFAWFLRRQRTIV